MLGLGQRKWWTASTEPREACWKLLSHVTRGASTRHGLAQSSLWRPWILASTRSGSRSRSRSRSRVADDESLLDGRSDTASAIAGQRCLRTIAKKSPRQSPHAPLDNDVGPLSNNSWHTILLIVLVRGKNSNVFAVLPRTGPSAPLDLRGLHRLLQQPR